VPEVRDSDGRYSRWEFDKSGKWRGRFIIERDDDGMWNVIDDIESLCVGFNTKREALDAAKFCRDYVRKWGWINVSSFPYTLDQEPCTEGVD
jgi:hypothetical protein